MNKPVTAILVLSVLAISALLITYLAIPHIAISLLEKAYGLNVSCKSAILTPHFNSEKDGGFKIAIDLKDVRISKKGAVAGAYESLGALVSAPFDGSLKYREIKGIIRPRPGHILINDLVADGDDIKVFLKGTFFYKEDRVELNMVIHFSKDFTARIPKELSQTFLADSSRGGGTLSVNLKGSLKSPAIEVSSRLFRLSIREVSGK